ncbi:MAG TPA: GGDEF domain-containing protein [Thermoanaerobaculia bacterium]|nr:GGDEF domain-containing protein [Thermoanaerobaculia bacterium]
MSSESSSHGHPAGPEPRSALDECLTSFATVGGPVAVITLDLDGLHQINESSGHIAGDAVLAAVGKVVDGTARRYRDARSFRYGSDEFVVVLSGYSHAEIAALSDVISSRVRELKVDGVSEPLTLSAGASVSPPWPIADVLARSFAMLEKAKRAGGNRSEFDSDPGERPPVARRIVLNPQLFRLRDKTLRFAFVHTERYQRVADQVAQNSDISIDCVSVMGRSDLIIAHFGDRERRFLSELQALLVADSDAADARSVPYFEVFAIRKFHGYTAPADRDLSPISAEALATLVDAAEGRRLNERSEDEVREWIERGYALGLEEISHRTGEFESYITVDVDGGRADNIAAELFDVIVREDLLPSPHVVSVYEGQGARMHAQYMLLVRATAADLFDLVESLHRRCERLLLPRIQTSTFMISRYKALRAYRNLRLPPLTAEQKTIRDTIVLPELTAAERVEFLTFRPDLHPQLLDTVGRLNERFASLSIPNEYLPSRHPSALRRSAIRTVLTGDQGELRGVFLDIMGAIESGLRRLAVDVVRTAYSDLEEAVRDGVIPQRAASKDLQALTLSEVRDILRQLHGVRGVLVDRLPTLRDLERMRLLIDVRNKLAHGVVVPPDEGIKAMSELVSFASDTADILFAT